MSSKRTGMDEETVTHEGGGDGDLSLLVVIEGAGVVHALPSRGEVSLGRDEANDIRIDDASVSRRHALLTVGPEVRVRDLGSANGTRLAGRTLSPDEDTRVEPGAVLELGGVWVVLHDTRSREGRPLGLMQDGEHVMVPRDPGMQELVQLVERIAPSNLSVLILGETGVGKEVVAETIHRLSRRSDGPFLRLNCAALPRSLLEAELFGHEKGSFTGATTSKAGLFEAADGGTVLLDEIGELPLDIQVALLRVLEDRRVMRIGSREPRKVDVRFLAATHRDPRAAIEEGTFRQDLYYRLNGCTLRVPPLRERPGELEGLCRLFAARAAEQAGLPRVPGLTPETMALLRAYPWPGNVRELRNVMERAVVLSGGAPVAPSHLPAELREAQAAAGGAPQPAGGGLRDELSQIERQRILDALERCSGNQTRAARELGMSRRTLIKRLDEYGIPRPRKKA